ncbi:hypothetical protein [Pseudomonas asiatica]|uniref:hypothetical protein n=1 Tax=Pseudomonas asiatica TaxID=2219225 RepID=UPI003877E4E4
MIRVEYAQFEMLEERPIPEWEIRVTVKGSGFVIRALPLMAQVGDLIVEGLQLNPDGTGFVGYLPTEPAQGSMLRVGYPEGELVKTEFTYHKTIP